MTEPNHLSWTKEKELRHLVPPSSKKDLSKLDDLQIWRLFKKGREEALVFIYRNFVDTLYNYGCQFTHEKELVKDTVQEFFIELIRNKHNLSDTDSIKFYLFKGFRRKLVRALKKEAKYSNVNMADDSAGFKILQSPELRFIEEQMDEAQQKILKEKFNHLPKKQREALLLYYYEGMGYAEIAQLFEMSQAKSARVLIYRAINNLALELKDYRDIFLPIGFLLSLFF